jgi:ribosomal protein L12E/L44/L45/RPP1/RPP2
MKRTITIPADVDLGQPEAVDVVIRKLSHKSLEKAAEARQADVAKFARQAGPEMMGVIRDAAEAQAEAKAKTEDKKEPTEKERREARYQGFDRESTLVAGIESWTAPEKLPDSIADLDESTANLLFHEIVDLSLGPLDPAEAEAVGKGGSGRSTSSLTA